MAKKPKWGLTLTDGEFVDLSMQYFALQSWDLHTAICLWNKLDPNKENPSVGENQLSVSQSDACSDDPTDRGFKVAYEAIKCPDDQFAKAWGILRLPSLKCPPDPKSAKEITVNPRHFIVWVGQKYPDGQPHMVMAETAYQERKKAKAIKKETWSDPKPNALAHRKIAREQFIKMVEERKIDLKQKGIAKELAVSLRKRLLLSITNPYKVNTLRSKAMIPAWIHEYLAKQ